MLTTWRQNQELRPLQPIILATHWLIWSPSIPLIAPKGPADLVLFSLLLISSKPSIVLSRTVPYSKKQHFNNSFHLITATFHSAVMLDLQVSHSQLIYKTIAAILQKLTSAVISFRNIQETSVQIFCSLEINYFSSRCKYQDKLEICKCIF